MLILIFIHIYIYTYAICIHICGKWSKVSCYTLFALPLRRSLTEQCVAVRCSVLQRVAACCSVLQRVAARRSNEDFKIHTLSNRCRLRIRLETDILKQYTFEQYTFENTHSNNTHSNPCTGWRRLIGRLKLQVICLKGATNYRALLQKMTYEDKASYGSPPSCTSNVGGHILTEKRELNRKYSLQSTLLHMKDIATSNHSRCGRIVQKSGPSRTDAQYQDYSVLLLTAIQ